MYFGKTVTAALSVQQATVHFLHPLFQLTGVIVQYTFTVGNSGALLQTVTLFST